nr:unnamed protein product [Digitaria exilis]
MQAQSLCISIRSNPEEAREGRQGGDRSSLCGNSSPIPPRALTGQAAARQGMSSLLRGFLTRAHSARKREYAGTSDGLRAIIHAATPAAIAAVRARMDTAPSLPPFSPLVNARAMMGHGVGLRSVPRAC